MTELLCFVAETYPQQVLYALRVNVDTKRITETIREGNKLDVESPVIYACFF